MRVVDGQSSVQGGELHRRSSTGAIGIVSDDAGGAVVADPVGGGGGGGAGEERRSRQCAERPGGSEDRVLQQDSLVDGVEIEDSVDVRRRVEGGVEQERVGVGTANEE